MPTYRRVGVVAGLTAGLTAAAYRFAHVYRVRAGFPHRRPPRFTPADLGLPFEETIVRSDTGDLPAWFIPARGGAPGPGVVLVHGWDSARDRTLPNAVFLHAAGFHCLTFDVRGNGANPAEILPISTGEYGADAAAAFATLLARPEVTVGGILGHSMGGTGAILAAAADPRIAALVSVSAPSDPRRMVRQTFRLAQLPFPGPIATPLSWLTTRVYVRPRGHALRAISARHAIARYRGPVLIAHGRDDAIMPVEHARRIAMAALASRRSDSKTAPVELLVVDGGGHSWFYEDETFRRTVAGFLARELGGPLTPEAAADAAAGADARRLPDTEIPLVGERASEPVRALVGRPAAGEP
ncbi:MAG: alpha/beta fold hydrolase [Chloroflexota bacterium]